MVSRRTPRRENPGPVGRLQQGRYLTVVSRTSCRIGGKNRCALRVSSAGQDSGRDRSGLRRPRSSRRADIPGSMDDGKEQLQGVDALVLRRPCPDKFPRNDAEKVQPSTRGQSVLEYHFLELERGGSPQ